MFPSLNSASVQTNQAWQNSLNLSHFFLMYFISKVHMIKTNRAYFLVPVKTSLVSKALCTEWTNVGLDFHMNGVDVASENPSAGKTFLTYLAF